MVEYAEPEFIDFAVVATPVPGSPLWQIEAVTGDNAAALDTSNIADSQAKILTKTQVRPEHVRSSRLRSAKQAGFEPYGETGLWAPVEVPLPLPKGSPVSAEVEIMLIEIAFGSIVIRVQMGATDFEISLDDMEDDLDLWVRFLSELFAGGFPHAALAKYGAASFAVFAAEPPGTCRFVVDIDAEDCVTRHDVVCPRELLERQFRALIIAIADHPNLAHHFLFHASLPEQEYDRTWDEAEVNSPYQPSDDENYDDHRLFIVANISTIPLRADFEAEAITVRQQLRKISTG